MGESAVGVGAELGRVAGVWRYPVKSMAPDAVPSAEVSWHGVTGDRRWAFIQERSEASGFPWLTIRDRADMVRYRPRFDRPEQANASPVVVTTPTGAELDVADPALAAELGDGVRAVKLDRGTFDTLPLSLITTQSVASLGLLVGRPLDMRRFRPNVVIDAHDANAIPEENWTSCTLRIGDALVRVDARDQRCIVVNVDPTTAQPDPIVFRTIARRRKARLGVYATTVRPGRVAVGDPVVIVALPMPPTRVCAE
jgi:MOSC domain-containing protein